MGATVPQGDADGATDAAGPGDVDGATCTGSGDSVGTGTATSGWFPRLGVGGPAGVVVTTGLASARTADCRRAMTLVARRGSLPGGAAAVGTGGETPRRSMIGDRACGPPAAGA